MSNVNITPNMNLPNPVPGVDPGIDYANNNQSCFNQIDQHNHSAGQGVQINPGGLNINSDLPFNGNNATILKTVRFLSQGSPIANSAPNVACLYVSGNELWYNDFTGGNQVQITANGLINATANGISSGTASAVFSAGTLVVKSSSTSYGNVSLQSVNLANSGNLVNQLTLLAPTLSSSYNITLPTLPAQTNVVTIDSSGNMGSITYDAVGQGMTSVGSDAIANGRTRATGTSVAAGGVAISASCGNYTYTGGPVSAITNLSVTIVTTGRPVMVLCQCDTSGNTASFETFNNGGPNDQSQSQVTLGRDSLTARSTNDFGGFFGNTSATEMFYPPSSVAWVDTPTAGSHTYVAYASNLAGCGLAANWVILVAYEL